MPSPRPQQQLLLLAAAWSLGLLCLAAAEGRGGSCELSVERGDALYNFSLAAPTPAHRHGVLSEDGFYKVAMNDSVIWFQLCDQMIFNFDPPVCLHCEASVSVYCSFIWSYVAYTSAAQPFLTNKDCGGPLRCGTQCSALASNNIGGYDVCTIIGSASGSHISLIEDGNPQKGVIVKMFSSKCSISVFIFCDSAVAQLPDKFSQSGSCDYVTILRHPSGCARSVSDAGNGWGWFGTSFITIAWLLGGYILIGAIYRYYFVGIRSVEAIPNLEFWMSLPQRIKRMFVRSRRNPRSQSRDTRGPYTTVNH